MIPHDNSATARMKLSTQAMKLIELHSKSIVAAAGWMKNTTTAGKTIATTRILLDQRTRYVAATGEHFDLHEYEGIAITDALDERLIGEARGLVRAYAERAAASNLEMFQFLAETVPPPEDHLPPYPVAFMIHRECSAAFKAFDFLIMEAAADGARGLLETAFLRELDELLNRYWGTRQDPVTRHVSDVAREYSVVARLKCSCGAQGFETTRQSLHESHDGAKFDLLDLQCRVCGFERSITFDLPYFRDLEKV